MTDEIRAIIFNLDGIVLEPQSLKPAHDQAEATSAAAAADLVYGAMDLLDASRDKYSLAGVTSMSRILQHLVFDKFALHYYFDAVITGDELKKTDPPGNPYLFAMQYLKDFPDQCVAIVDSVEHVYLARKAGCTVLALSMTAAAKDLAAAGAEQVAANFDELKKLIGLEETFIKT